MDSTGNWAAPASAALGLILCAAAPAYAGGETHRPACAATIARTEQQIALFAPHVRRATAAYLQLRLLELREEGLDRARAVIEGRLPVDALLAAPVPPGEASAARPNAAAGKAPPPRCRTVHR